MGYQYPYCEKGDIDCRDQNCACIDDARYRRRFRVAYAEKHGEDHVQMGHLPDVETMPRRNRGLLTRILVWLVVPLGFLIGILFATGIVE